MTPYFGQTLGGGSVEKVSKKRWRDEVSQARRENKQVGFIALLDEFGEDAFEWVVLESRRLPRLEAQEWADEREIALIAEHGGPLRDMDLRLTQTLNLTKGGKGVDATLYWAAMEALCKKSWTRCKKELQAYVDEHGTALVPYSHVTASGYRLGQAVIGLRTGQMLVGRPDEKERREWLEYLPEWSYKLRDHQWETYKMHLQAFVDTNGTAHVPNDYVTECGYPLGEKVRDLRRGQMIKGKPDEQKRRDWHQLLPGWSWSPHEDSWEKAFKPELLLFVDTNDTALVPRDYVSPSGYPLGKKMNELRTNDQFLRGATGPKRRDFLERLPGFAYDGIAGRKRAREEAATTPKEKAKLKKSFETNERAVAKRKTDVAALKAFGIDIKFKDLPKLRKDGTVARAHAALRERQETVVVPEKKTNPHRKAEDNKRNREKRRSDTAALKAFVPDAKQKDLSKYRADGTVQLAHEFLRERKEADDAAEVEDVLECVLCMVQARVRAGL
jgi:hypothetical protein